MTLKFEIKAVDGKGQGLFTLHPIEKHTLVIMYAGEHITKKEADEREEIYGDDDHCYMFYYSKRDKQDRLVKMCIDATRGTHDSRYINHSKKSANLKPTMIDGVMWFRAICDIAANSELLFDYGETRRDVLQANPWLRE